MIIAEIYESYEIPPNLQEHQLTVASVAQTVCDVQVGFVETDAVVRACLLHDMGNIIKFKLESTDPGLALGDVEHWRTVQKRFIAKYGPSEHEATLAIAREIGVPSRILELLDMIGFSHARATLESGDRAAMIASYSDMRVSPTGVTSLHARLDNIRERYGSTPERVDMEKAYEAMEKELFTDVHIAPEDITDESVAVIRNQLRQNSL